MRRVLPLFQIFAFAAMAAAQAPAPSRPGLFFPEPVADRGEHYQMEEIVHRFVLENRSILPVRILGVEPLSKAGTARFEPAVVEPGGHGEVVVSQAVGDKLGEAAFRFKVMTDDPAAPEQKLILKLFAQSAYDPETMRLDLGVVSRSDARSEGFEFATREAAVLQYLGAVDPPSWLAIESLGLAAEGGLRIRVKVLPTAPLGIQNVLFRIRTDLARQPEFIVTVRATVLGNVVPTPTHLDFGLTRLGQTTEQRLRLERPDGGAIEIAGIEGTVPGVTAEQIRCAPAVAGASPSDRPDCGGNEVMVRVTPEATGSLTGTLQIRLVGETEPIPVSFAALVVAADTQVKSVPASATESAPGLPRFPIPPTPPVESAPSEPSHKGEVSIKWRAAKETVYGYLIYRAEARGGPYLRLNPSIVRVKDAGDAYNDYRYTDSAVEPGRTYYYYLDSVSRGGQKRRFSGVLVRKIAPDAQ